MAIIICNCYTVIILISITLLGLLTYLWVRCISWDDWFRWQLSVYSVPSHYLNYCWFIIHAWHRNTFCITEHLWGESISHLWILSQNASNRKHCCFLCCLPKRTVEQTFKLLVIWDATTLMSRGCNEEPTQYSVLSTNDQYGSGHRTAAVLLPCFAINW